jgi:hypothetical protein
MHRDPALKRAMSAWGVCVLGVFLFGLNSAPLRPCLNHPGHASGEHESEIATDHASHHSQANTEGTHDQDHVGCTCLGHCSLEHAPYLKGTADYEPVRSPDAPRTLIAAKGRANVVETLFRVPLARPPPSVV